MAHTHTHKAHKIIVQLLRVRNWVLYTECLLRNVIQSIILAFTGSLC